MSNYKSCTICKKSLPATDEYFYKQKGGKLGFKGRCKVCWKLHVGTWKKNNPKKVSLYRKRYYLKHKEQLLNYQKEWRKRRDAR